MKKLVTFKIVVEVKDEGDFDEGVMRDALVDAYFRAEDEGDLTSLSDETTTFGSVSVSHVSTILD